MLYFKKMKMEETSVRKTKTVGIIAAILGVLIWMALNLYGISAALHGDDMMLVSGALVMGFALIPYLLMGGLYGYVISMAGFFCAFVFALIFNMDNAFKMAIYLAPALCFSLFSQYFWFMSFRKTILACAITLAGTSILEMACLTIIAERRYSLSGITSHIGDLGKYLLRDAGSIFLCGVLLFLFFTRMPDICKLPFPIGIGYTRAYQENQQIKRDLRKTRVSVKISIIIIGVELILGISAGVFMIALFPDMKQMFIARIDGTETAYQDDRVPPTKESAPPEENEGEMDEDFRQRMEDLNFRLDARTLSYDIKMVLMMLCVGVPMAAFANFYTKMSIGMPLGMMSDFMEEYAAADDDRKLEVGRGADRIRVRSHDEIRIVGDSIKTTVHAIEDYIGRLKEEQELEKELEIAQKASEAKSSFLSNMSHEIRTPINAVLGMNEMILRESEDARIQEYAQSVKSAGNSLLGLVNDILDFSRIEAGKLEILPVEYHLSSMINDLINMISVKAKDKGLEFNVNVDEKTPATLIGDEVRIKQCVTNILTNAVKYTETGSVTMDVGFEDAPDGDILLNFSVSDTGIGIREEDLSKLFSPFERIEEIRNRSIEGTGLGMSIVKKLLALMDTKLEVQSVYGQGSTFSFAIRQRVADRDEIGDFREKYKEYLKTLEKYHERFHAPDAEILVVDDTPINLTVVAGLLKSTMIKVDTAESGQETLRKVTEKRYDAIFIDHRMPQMDGLETLAAMKELADNLNTGVPCIALTANAGVNAKREYLEAGFDDYLSKPVDGDALEKMLKHYLPPEKVQDAEADEAESENEAEPEDDFLNELQGIDLAEALKNCGSREILKEAVRDFLISIETKAGNIERMAADADYRNYTVAVHALKSTARLVGALKLSADAAYLEECGNAENADEIAAKTPALLELYRSYSEKFSAADDPAEDDDKPEISGEELSGAFADMRELLEAYDFDTADGIMEMLSGYRIPEEYLERYEKVRELMAAVDRDGLLDIL